MVVAGELHCGGHAFFASFHEAETSAAYLMLPTPSGRIAPRFVASIFGDHALHGCAVTMTMPSCGYGPGCA